MTNVLHLKNDEKALDETASLTKLCRMGATRCFVFHNPFADELHYFACVELGREQYALYSHSNDPGSRGELYHFEDFVHGGLSSAIDHAQKLMGECWIPLSV